MSGEFNKKQFYEACYNFIMQHEKNTISPYLKMKNIKDGSQKYTYEEAFKECVKKYFYTFYDGL